MRNREKLLLGACFFLSGGTSLALEVAWSKELSYILGNTLFAVSTVVAAFMAGLGTGSAIASRVAGRFPRPLRTYAVLQLAIGAWGAASLPLFRATEPLFGTLYRTFDPGHGAFLLARFAAVFLLMFLPAVLMGMTLPVVVGALARAKERYDLEAGMLYGVNTLGAVLGTLAAGLTLIPALGLLRTCLLAGAIDGIVGVTSLVLDRGVGTIRDVRRDPERRGGPGRAAPVEGAGRPAWTGRQWLVAGVFGISGAVAMVYEVGWFRLLSLAMGPSVYAFSAMLGLFLAGVGMGSAAASRPAREWRGGAVSAMAWLEGILGLVSLLSLFYLNALPRTNFHLSRWAIDHHGEAGLALTRLAVSAMVVFLPCLVMGMLFPFAVRAVREAGRGDAMPEATVGRLYLLNTVGGILGSLAAGFWLVPRIGAWETLRIAGVASALLGATLALAPGARAPEGAKPGGRARRGRGWGSPAVRRIAAAGGLLAAVALAWSTPPWDVLLYNQGLYREAYRNEPFPARRLQVERLLFHREGTNAPVAVLRSESGVTLYISGKPDASLNPHDLNTQLLAGHLSVMLAPHPRRVAVVGYGSGMTVGAMLLHPEVESLDLLEIEQGVIEASPYFEGVNGNPFDDPRTRVVLEDGRVHLTHTDAVYDVISSEPSNPWMAGVSNLFTTDFYGAMRRRLAPGGVFAQWIQAYDTSEEIFRTVLASLRESFPHVMVFRTNPGDCIVLASERPVAIPWETFRARFEREPVRASFLRIGIRSPLEVPFFLHGPETAMTAFADTPRRNTDDNVWLEYQMPRTLLRTAGSPSAVSVAETISRLGSKVRIRGIEALLPGVPIDDCVREILLYPYREAAPVGIGVTFADTWGPSRPVLEAGLRDEALAIGRPALAARVEEWRRAGEADLATRVRVAGELAEESKGSRIPPPERLARWAAETPDFPLVLLFLANDAERRGELGEAETRYQALLRHPESGVYYEAMVALARLARRREALDLAIRWCDLAIARDPVEPRAHEMSVRLHLLRRDRDGAARALERGLRFVPADPDLEAAADLLRGPS